MQFYIKSLFFAIPTFIVLILFEAIAAKFKGVEINRSADVISSLSSGITNTIRDGVKFSFAIISYAWLVDHMTVYKLEPVWLAVVIAFMVQDFSGYWMHRLNHRVNIFWNRHIIHHSSEDFNLSCALRQSISNTLRFSAIFMIPAALLGVPAAIFAILGPLHLFMQFWYHTQLIGKLGLLEYILVTPSHHRVHHAINPEYIDKNYSQILIIWDKLFGTFQPELDNVNPVYGTLKQMKTWNPMIINFKHMWHLIKDAWHTERVLDKLRIWFMPTGWRPADVKEKYPLQTIADPKKQIKYNTKNSPLLIAWSWTQLVITNILMFHFFSIIPSFSTTMNYLYAVILIANIFSFTSTLDQRNYALAAESVKLILVFSLLYFQNYNWFGLNGVYVYALILYFITSFLLTVYFKNEKKISSPHPHPA
ncbi:MAG TPA: fatty acid hydroxylase family protein [Candidatus Marinimicrobia bacterium]|jgi:sterol desaturase/sphingolipid hydroxylase (fatty acid hydroxylase superfamily)|nr:fatty acid hydroxylase family protein [Candidatus Neomarinimicrobiota bacterium]HIB95675.1 fatty acid hydroxylase family protein [Candidatus Neomarinimicrobiota bacterium]HIO36176.1 fatty acid hydroxylase family protein [Candidatus Neomarinimicrobiota bacterium]HIO55456.1 fatty acid hydroxylase family protein [Candidatus Neomarinimicrobiota bacterium]HIO89948.1 fatty acid hydroxylase family protein [Candidatus Neomarinimicrobiota bacterium]